MMEVVYSLVVRIYLLVTMTLWLDATMAHVNSPAALILRPAIIAPVPHVTMGHVLILVAMI
jgi:hypothetical protein